MPGLGAEMRQVDLGHRIGRGHAQHGTRGHGNQPLARTQDGQGAKQPPAIQILIPGHGRAIAAQAIAVHGNVTRGRVTPPPASAMSRERGTACSE